ncbi:hypothetical protein LTR78_003833 [Recurvomyces mirabilis]|uniref:ubiquitinyl hydrolase 1 n=1 Tax=Recurvomyces mirabilis TaxID=574656 RepID=A0AAE0WR20_9PEZI|nr:hypothetical protein LTR78_003833 [Recurvomyces mirabilis]KAK5154028.1 hypothetical protein LTS14_007248 [Recurvomyces mirabilis]
MAGGNEDGGAGSGQQQVQRTVSPTQSLGARSVSPAKRSAADMDGDDMAQDEGQVVPGSFEKTESDGLTDYDHVLAGMQSKDTNMDITQDSAVTSIENTQTANSSATSLSDSLPPYTETEKPAISKSTPHYTTEEIDVQLSKVMKAMSNPLDIGDKGIVVSKAWLERVLSRTSDGLKSSDFPKEAREGPIGPIDNSSIVVEDGFSSSLSDGRMSTFIPLKPGLQIDEDISLIPNSVWGVVASNYGLAKDQHQINRYAINTAPDDATQQNIAYDLYPLVITLRKVPQLRDTERPITPKTSVESLRWRKEQRTLGQLSPDDAIKLVASRSERFQNFLKRSKEAAAVPRTTKVKIWRLLNPQNVSVDQPSDAQRNVLSPPPSRASSPAKAAKTSDSKLILSTSEFKAMEIGKHLEPVDTKDMSHDDNYNGRSTLQLLGIFEDQTLVLEEMIGGPAGGEFLSDNQKRSGKPPTLTIKNSASKPSSTTNSGRTSPAPGGMLTRGRARRDGRVRGCVGLTNLGNTCYMNSALQCIRSVEELAIYFLVSTYKKEINVNNPLGHGGVMAKQYAGVLNGIYGDNSGGSFTPREFKTTLGRLQPMFSGYGQQDSQEFLSFLVDALHEDLNRIEKKPYIENPDSDDARVRDKYYIAELGETYRSNHKKRNESICMDLFSGFYKNTMECPVCDKVSVTFDPYSLLTVQIPFENTFTHPFTFVPQHGPPVNHAIDMDKNATIKMVKQNVASKHPGVSEDRLWMIEVYSHKIYKVFHDDSRTLSDEGIGTSDHIFVFELDAVPTNLPEVDKKEKFTPYSSWNSSKKEDIPGMDSEKAACLAVPVFPRQKNRMGNGWDISMHPLYITVTREEAQDFEIILKKVLFAVSNQTSRAILTEDDDASDEDEEPQTNGHVDQSTAEDGAQVSDCSMPSEDGYVEVSVSKAGDDGTSESMQDVVTEPAAKVNPIPKHFMEPQYTLPQSLRNGMFALNYASSSDGMLCASMSSIVERTVCNMYDRVKKPVRRPSTTSISESSTTSAATGQADEDDEESDADDDEEDKPDLVIGGEDAMSAPTPMSETQDSNDEDLPPPEKFIKRRGGKCKKGKNKRNRKQKGYSRKDRQANRNNRQNTGAQNGRLTNGNTTYDEDNPFYIKLGEAIVLDWYPEALDGVFGGKADDENELRGHWLSTPTGKDLPFISDPVLEAKKQTRAARRKHGVTLEDCFQETGKREILSADNAWYCNRCKEMRQAAKTLEIWTAPDILIVHMKRFGGGRISRDKIDVLVDYPVGGLDLTKKIGSKEDGKEYIYDLFAVDNHFGGLGGGHYTALAKNFNDGQWYDYNDSTCSKVSESRIHSAAAYLLFYRRRSDKPLGPQYLQELVNDFRNPPEIGDATEADDEESGEGKLGGLTPSLHGSSSALVVAGADKTTSGKGLNTAGSGSRGVGSSLMTRMSNEGSEESESSLGMLDGKPLSGPQRPPHLQYGSQGNNWSFDAIGSESAQPATEADDSATGNLLDLVQDGDEFEAEDNDSTDALGDRSDDDDNEGGFFREGVQRYGTPLGSEMEFGDAHEDDHSAYMDARGYSHEYDGGDIEMQHMDDVEDTPLLSEDKSGVAVEIILDDDVEAMENADGHVKMA